jgi:hypothetical protein
MLHKNSTNTQNQKEHINIINITCNNNKTIPTKYRDKIPYPKNIDNDNDILPDAL